MIYKKDRMNACYADFSSIGFHCYYKKVVCEVNYGRCDRHERER